MKAVRAVTLVELLVVLVIMGLVAGVVGLTIQTARPVEATDQTTAAIESARDSAIRYGRSVTTLVSVKGAQREITANPDGRVIADGALGVDPLTGMRNATP